MTDAEADKEWRGTKEFAVTAKTEREKEMAVAIIRSFERAYLEGKPWGVAIAKAAARSFWRGP